MQEEMEVTRGRSKKTDEGGGKEGRQAGRQIVNDNGRRGRGRKKPDGGEDQKGKKKKDKSVKGQRK